MFNVARSQQWFYCPNWSEGQHLAAVQTMYARGFWLSTYIQNFTFIPILTSWDRRLENGKPGSYSDSTMYGGLID